MTPDFRALCEELLTDYEQNRFRVELAAEARTLLAQPVAEGPTDEEIEEWADACPEAPLEEMDPEVHGWRRCFTAKEFSETIRAVLARWGRPTPQPESHAFAIVEKRLEHLADDQQLMIYRWPEVGEWDIHHTNPSTAVRLGEVNGKYGCTGRTLEEAVCGLAEELEGQS